MTDGHEATDTADDAAAAEPVFRVVAGSPSAEELAAVTAVLTVLDAERRAADADLAELSGPTAWQRSQRALRAPLTPGPGRWGSWVD